MKNNVLLSLVLFLSIMLSGCCANYKTYVASTASDLDALESTYVQYVLEDERLSEADRMARLSVLKEMRDKNNIAKQDVD